MFWNRQLDRQGLTCRYCCSGSNFVIHEGANPRQMGCIFLREVFQLAEQKTLAQQVARRRENKERDGSCEGRRKKQEKGNANISSSVLY